jgi:acyl-CoA reductase-like NAD-dependent aldehyde dehydrogenase
LFTQIDPGTGKAWASSPNNGPEDVDATVQAAHNAFQKYRKSNPRIRAQQLLKWHNLIIEAKEDLAHILTYETGKPLAESRAELDYSLGFTWWFAGEAERIRGTVATPAIPGRRVFTVKQPIGVAVALVPWNFPIAWVVRVEGYFMEEALTSMAG